MAYNQYYGGQENYMPMQNQSYYQPNVMSPTPHTPRIGPSTPMTQPPQTTPMMQMNQMPTINQMPPMNPIPQINTAPQVNQMPQSNAQYQYANNSAMNYVAPVSPMTQTPIASNHYEMQSGMMNQMPSNTTPQNYSPPVNQSQFPVMPQTAGVYPSTNVYSANNQVGYSSMALPQTSSVPGMMTNNVFTDQQQYGVPMSQQMSYPTNGNVQPMSQMPITQTQPVYAGEPCNPQSPTNPAQPTALAKQEEPDNTFKPTNVIGQYKCSDFPTLYSGNYRYNESPIQRKPFTMKGESLKPFSHGQTDRRTNIGLNRYGKRWELRGGKYYGCFTSRTNGLQDICPKAKCRLCPNENKKK